MRGAGHARGVGAFGDVAVVEHERGRLVTKKSASATRRQLSSADDWQAACAALFARGKQEQQFKCEVPNRR